MTFRHISSNADSKDLIAYRIFDNNFNQSVNSQTIELIKWAYKFPSETPGDIHFLQIYTKEMGVFELAVHRSSHPVITDEIIQSILKENYINFSKYYNFINDSQCQIIPSCCSDYAILFSTADFSKLINQGKSPHVVLYIQNLRSDTGEIFCQRQIKALMEIQKVNSSLGTRFMDDCKACYFVYLLACHFFQTVIPRLAQLTDKVVMTSVPDSSKPNRLPNTPSLSNISHEFKLSKRLESFIAKVYEINTIETLQKIIPMINPQINLNIKWAYKFPPETSKDVYLLKIGTESFELAIRRSTYPIVTDWIIQSILNKSRDDISAYNEFIKGSYYHISSLYKDHAILLSTEDLLVLINQDKFDKVISYLDNLKIGKGKIFYQIQIQTLIKIQEADPSLATKIVKNFLKRNGLFYDLLGYPLLLNKEHLRTLLLNEKGLSCVFNFFCNYSKLEQENYQKYVECFNEIFNTFSEEQLKQIGGLIKFEYVHMQKLSSRRSILDLPSLRRLNPYLDKNYQAILSEQESFLLLYQELQKPESQKIRQLNQEDLKLCMKNIALFELIVQILLDLKKSHDELYPHYINLLERAFKETEAIYLSYLSPYFDREDLEKLNFINDIPSITRLFPYLAFETKKNLFSKIARPEVEECFPLTQNVFLTLLTKKKTGLEMSLRFLTAFKNITLFDSFHPYKKTDGVKKDNQLFNDALTSLTPKDLEKLSQDINPSLFDIIENSKITDDFKNYYSLVRLIPYLEKSVRNALIAKLIKSSHENLLNNPTLIQPCLDYLESLSSMNDYSLLQIVPKMLHDFIKESVRLSNLDNIDRIVLLAIKHSLVNYIFAGINPGIEIAQLNSWLAKDKQASLDIIIIFVLINRGEFRITPRLSLDIKEEKYYEVWRNAFPKMINIFLRAFNSYSIDISQKEHVMSFFRYLITHQIFRPDVKIQTPGRVRDEYPLIEFFAFESKNNKELAFSLVLLLLQHGIDFPKYLLSTVKVRASVDVEYRQQIYPSLIERGFATQQELDLLNNPPSQDGQQLFYKALEGKTILERSFIRALPLSISELHSIKALKDRLKTFISTHSSGALTDQLKGEYKQLRETYKKMAQRHPHLQALQRISRKARAYLNKVTADIPIELLRFYGLLRRNGSETVHETSARILSDFLSPTLRKKTWQELLDEYFRCAEIVEKDSQLQQKLLFLHGTGSGALISLSQDKMIKPGGELLEAPLFVGEQSGSESEFGHNHKYVSGERLTPSLQWKLPKDGEMFGALTLSKVCLSFASKKGSNYVKHKMQFDLDTALNVTSAEGIKTFTGFPKILYNYVYCLKALGHHDHLQNTLTSLQVPDFVLPYRINKSELISVLQKNINVSISSKDYERYIKNQFPIIFASTSAPSKQLNYCQTEFIHQGSLSLDSPDLIAFTESEKVEILQQFLQHKSLPIKVYNLEVLYFLELQNMMEGESSLEIVEILAKNRLSSTLPYSSVLHSLNTYLKGIVFSAYHVPFTDVQSYKTKNGEERFIQPPYYGYGISDYKTYRDKVLEGKILPREVHGPLHVARGILWILACIPPNSRSTLTKETILQIIKSTLAYAYHDIARKGDGEDFWDEESAEMLRKMMTAHFLDLHLDLKELIQAIAEKDPSSNHFGTETQKDVNRADTIEILRCLNNPNQFIFSKLLPIKDMDEAKMKAFILECYEFIKFTEQPSRKKQLSLDLDPLKNLLQILGQEVNNGRFPILGSRLEKEMNWALS